MTYTVHARLEDGSIAAWQVDPGEDGWDECSPGWEQALKQVTELNGVKTAVVRVK